MIGWCAAGGMPTDLSILEVALFFFIWQIPHFWLLLHLYGGEYEGAGLPSPTGLLTRVQFRRITFAWVLPTAACGFMLAGTFGLGMPWNLMVLAGSTWIVYEALKYRKREPTRASGASLFHRLNLYALSMMLILMASALAS